MRRELRRVLWSLSLCAALLGSGCRSRSSQPPQPPQPGGQKEPTKPGEVGGRPDRTEHRTGHRSGALPRTTREPLQPLKRVDPDRLLALVAPPPGTSGAPLSLTASDGTGLVLSALKASAVVSGPLGFTELHLIFDNPEDRTLEGRFEITLPPGAAISRFAMLMPDGWREAEVVERQRARAAYEDFLHRRQDPALLEREAGNQFSARVFPIPARGRKELKLSYSQELPASGRGYRLPLTGLPKLGRLEIVAIAGDEVTQVVKQDLVPQQDFEVRSPPNTLASAAGLRSDRIAIARVQVGGEGQGTGAALPLDKVLLLVDTSASRAAGFDKQIELVGALVEELKKAVPQSPLRVAAFDQAVAPIFDGAAAGFGAPQLAALRRRGPLGASDLAGALSSVKGAPELRRVLVITDGISTAFGGAGEQRAAVQALAPQVQRLDVVLVGGIRDEAAMRGLVTGVLPQAGLVLDGTQPTAALVERLQKPVISDLKVAVAGARWHWPHSLSGVQPGDEALIYAELPEGDPGQSLRIGLGEGGAATTREVPLTGASGPLLERAYAAALIQSLTHEREQLLNSDKQEAAALRSDIIELSTKHRVLSDFTALLVLETEQDYARFQLDRRALADILTVGERGIELVHRPPPAGLVDAPPKPAVKNKIFAIRSAPQNRDITLSRDARERAGEAAPQIVDPAAVFPPEQEKGSAAEGAPAGGSEPGQLARIFGRDSALGASPDDAMGGLVGAEVGDAYGAGGLGLTGSGSGGGGQGTTGLGNLGTIGRGYGGSTGYSVRGGTLRSRSSSAPDVTPGTPEVRGSLDRELIRRIVRRHVNEVKFCYERELTRSPGLQGRVMIQFTISPSGMVGTSLVQSSTIGNPAVEQCIAAAVRRWEFPKPSGGIAIANFPFVLKLSGDAPDPPDPADPPPSPRERAMRALAERARGETEEEPKSPSVPAYTGTMLEVMNHLSHGRTQDALGVARAWRERAAGDVLALTALGTALAASGDSTEAERAYGSIIDLFPSRADLRRYAGSRLEGLRQSKSALLLAADTYKKAVEQRPDHPSSHRLYAYALIKLEQPAAAFAALRAGLAQRYPGGRFLGVEQVLREDLGIVAAAWRRAEPARAVEIQKQLNEAGVAMASGPSLRFVLSWETDANDVDFHIHDGRGGHAYYSQKELRSGGELYADVTTGYGPECFAIPGVAAAYPYRLEAHYYSRGPMGYGMGKLQILAHDGKGGLRFEERPFVVMNDGAYVDLGRVNKPL